MQLGSHEERRLPNEENPHPTFDACGELDWRAGKVIVLNPIVLEGHGVRLEPLAEAHRDELAAATADGRLWELWFTAVPAPEDTARYVADALAGQSAGHMLPWVVRELESGQVVGSTRYHDIVLAIDRVEIGYTCMPQVGSAAT